MPLPRCAVTAPVSKSIISIRPSAVEAKAVCESSGEHHRVVTCAVSRLTVVSDRAGSHVDDVECACSGDRHQR